MRIPDEISAMRLDREPQRRAQAIMQRAQDRWQGEPGAAQMLGELAEFGKGAPLHSCPQLEAVFTSAGQAEALLARLSYHFCAGLEEEPFGHPSFRHSFDGQTATLLLARSGDVQLVLQSREPGQYLTHSYGFSQGLRFDAIAGGKAQARIVRKVEQKGHERFFCEEDIALSGGGRLAFDLSSETLAIDQVEQRLVVLRLIRGGQSAEPCREYDAQTAALLRQSAASLATSRQEATIALLGKTKRHDSAPVIAELALGDGDRSLRWQAVRECLVLDTALGFATLCQISGNPEDSLSAQAGALRANLLEAYPQLGRLKAA